jgi:hypothetical protein
VGKRRFGTVSRGSAQLFGAIQCQRFIAERSAGVAFLSSKLDPWVGHAERRSLILFLCTESFD